MEYQGEVVEPPSPGCNKRPIRPCPLRASTSRNPGLLGFSERSDRVRMALVPCYSASFTLLDALTQIT